MGGENAETQGCQTQRPNGFYRLDLRAGTLQRKAGHRAESRESIDSPPPSDSCENVEVEDGGEAGDGGQAAGAQLAAEAGGSFLLAWEKQLLETGWLVLPGPIGTPSQLWKVGLEVFGCVGGGRRG